VGRAGAYLVRVEGIAPADRAQFDMQKAELRAAALQRRQNQLFADWLGHLVEEAKISDFRAGVF
jgi:hypothetical protein